MSRASTDPRQAVQTLSEAFRALITCHRSPDGDALGSALALAALARELGTEAVIVNRDPAPSNLALLPGAEEIRVADRPPNDFPRAFDLVVAVECPTLDRAGFEGLERTTILNIDHHPQNPAYGDVNYLDEESPAVGEMVWRMYGDAGIWPQPEVATCLYTALATDTGDFRYSNATGRAFRAAAEMVDAGAAPATIAEWVHNHRSLPSVRLLGEAIRTLELSCNGRLARIVVDQDSFRRAEAAPEDTEEIVNVPRKIAGVEAVVFCKQWEPGVVRVSLRSRGQLNVRGVAETFGGGGHLNAAGCTIEGDLERVERDVAEAVSALLGERL